MPPSIQPVFDIVAAGRASGPLVAAAVISLSTAIGHCYREDVQPTVLPPLERFGRWLMVDPSRLRQGEQVLQRIPAPRLLSLNSILFTIGLDKRNAKGSFAQSLASSELLIGAFIFIVGCTSCMPTSMAAKLTHELLRLTGILNEYAIPESPVRQFADAVNGCAHLFRTESASDVYAALAMEVHNARGPASNVENLTHEPDVNEVATMLFQVFEYMADDEVTSVTLQGTWSGIWLSSLLVWLRPNEVNIATSGTQIYPQRSQTGPHDLKSRKLNMFFEGTHTPSAADMHPWSWNVTAWRAAKEDVPINFNLSSTERSAFYSYHAVPFRSARHQLHQIVSSAAVDSIGCLAGALVIVAVEAGHLSNKNGSIFKAVKDLCSPWFLGKHNTVMSLFGWEVDGDTTASTRLSPEMTRDVRREDRKGSMADAISRCLDTGSFIRQGDASDGYQALGSLIDDACRDYRDNRGRPMLVSQAERQEGLGSESPIVDHAIYLAVQALLLAFCEAAPKVAIHRPLDPAGLQQNARLLRAILRPPQPGADRTEYCTTWELRSRAFDVLLPNAPTAQPGDLAVAGNGYVAYSSALANWDGDLTNSRAALTFHIGAGPLKSDKVEGKLAKLSEDNQPAVLAARLLDDRNTSITLYQGDQCLLDEADARCRGSCSVTHLWRTDSSFGPQILHLSTYLLVPTGNGHVSKAPVSWERSMEALAFSRHVDTANARPTQLRSLSEIWETEGYTGDRLRWCHVGKAVATKTRYIAVTGDDERARFFEAGNLSASHAVFIRRRTGTLFECIKTAIETCREDEDWAIIA